MSSSLSTASDEYAATNYLQKGQHNAHALGSSQLPHEGEDSLDGSDKNFEKLGRNLSFLGLCGIAVSTGESWVVLGNSLTLAIYNGGSPGVIYGFIADSVCYWLVAASIAELASSMPSTATVYHWADVAGGRYGHLYSWYAGWWNLAAWIVGTASLLSFLTLQVLAMWQTTHQGFVAQNWEVFCVYALCTSLVVVLVSFGGKWLARLQSMGVFFTLAGWFISIIVCAVTPAVEGKKYQTSSNVWTDWENRTGWGSEGFVFCLGMVNAAFAICAPDITSHMAEEIPNPKRNIPLAILAQYIASFVTGLAYLITLFYAVPDLEAATSKVSVFPLSQLYLQATNQSTAVGLLVLSMPPALIGATGALGVAGRQCWALAREQATPFPSFLGQLGRHDSSPFNATILVGLLTIAVGSMYLGSSAAFNAIASSFVVFTSLSYLAALVPHLLSGRRNVRPGVFWMPGICGFVVTAFSCVYLAVFAAIFCFPPYLPVTADNMNYTSAIVGGWTGMVASYGLFCGRKAKAGTVDQT